MDIYTLYGLQYALIIEILQVTIFMNKFRKLSIYERNQLLKYSLQEADLLTKGDLPVEYLTGFVEFKNLEFKINRNVLIPRVETEELVDLMKNFVDSLEEKISYLEVGVGSGVISLSFLDFLLKSHKKNFLVEKFLLADISIEALSVAKENLFRLFPKKLPFLVEFLISDLLNDLSKQKFNLIAANLPYIPSSLMMNLDKSVKDYEPNLALDGGEDGFVLIAELIDQIIDGDFLSQNGKIFLEVHESHTIDFLKKKYPQILQKFLIKEIKDQFRRHRFLILQKL